MAFQWQIALNVANSAKRCGAKTKNRPNSSCGSPAMKNGRCYMHGGKSPGAPKGEKHGRYMNGLHTAESKDQRSQVRALIKAARAIIDQANR